MRGRTFVYILLTYLAFCSFTVMTYSLTSKHVVTLNGQAQYLCWVFRDLCVHLGLLVAALSQLVKDEKERQTASIIVVCYALFDIYMLFRYFNEYSEQAYLFYLGFIICSILTYIYRHERSRMD